MARTYLVRAPPRLSTRSVAFTFHAADFAGKTVMLYNVGTKPSFARVGQLRYTLGAGEEQAVTIPVGADYEIALGIGIRLE
jgi:hypothetical protein